MSKKSSNLLEVDISFGRVSIEEKVAFAKHLAVMLKAGLTISEALDILKSQSTGKMKKIIAQIAQSVDSGTSLSVALKKFSHIFPPIFINSIYIGESSGTLDENLESLALHMKKDKELMDKIKGAMFYPMIVMGLAFTLGLVISFVVLPKITPLFEGLNIELPLMTRMLISFSKVIQSYGTGLLLGIIGGVAVLLWLVRQKFSQPVTHYLLLNTPIISGITHNKNLTVFCSTLATLLKSGMNVDQAMNIVSETVDNYYFKKSLKDVSSKAGQGSKISENLSHYKKLFPPLAISMLKIGEKSGKMEESLFYLAEYYETEVNNATKKLSTAIEPMLLIFIGLMVGGLAIAIITPIYKITGNVQG